MIGSGVLDRHPKLQVLIVHLGGGLTSTIGRLDFNWHLNYSEALLEALTLRAFRLVLQRGERREP
jgi:predicted TIM-barrel fold metal-dependent hydrolase